MRPLTPEEASHVRGTVLQPLWLRAVVLVAILAAILLYDTFRASPPRVGWGLWLGLSPLWVVPLWTILRAVRLRGDLEVGSVDTLAGPVDRDWEARDLLTRQRCRYLQVSGHRLRAELVGFPRLVEGETIIVDFLPRSRIAVRVSQTGSGSA